MTNFHIALGTKVPAGFDVDIDSLTDTARTYLVQYGLKQSLNDCIAAIKVTDEDYTPDNTLAIVAKRFDAIQAGAVRQAGTREASDPIMAEARKLARQSFNARDDQTRKAALTTFRKAGVTGDDKTVIVAIVDRLAPQFKDEAVRIVASRKDALAGLADGLDDVLAGLVSI